MKRQQGMTLIGAIFILVIVALIGQYLVNVTSTQRQTGLLAIQSARAYQAANAGLEWGIAEVVLNNNCPASTALSLPNSNFTVTVTCNTNGTFTENVSTTNIFLIQSQSEYGSFGSPDYVARNLEVKILR